jgi:hypothetical protein
MQGSMEKRIGVVDWRSRIGSAERLERKQQQWLVVIKGGRDPCLQAGGRYKEKGCAIITLFERSEEEGPLC